MRAAMQELCATVEAGRRPGLHRALAAVDRALHCGQVAHRCREESDMDLQGRHSHVPGRTHAGQGEARAVGC